MESDSGQQLLEVTHSSGKTIIEGAEATGDDLELKCCSADDYPKILLQGNNHAYIYHPSGKNTTIVEATTAVLSIDLSGTEVRLVGETTNGDISINPNGTGVVKFGTHAAIGGETVTGYITIKDAAGNSRKIAVVS